MTVHPSPERWFYRPRKVQGIVDTRLFCFPFGGGGASAYRDWPRALPPGTDLVAVRPPGRESRIGEPPYADTQQLVADLQPLIEPLLDRPFAFFGHSMGALVSFELARRLVESGAPGPGHIFVSARRAPTVPDRLPPIGHLSQPDFLEEVRSRFGDMVVALVDDPEARDLLLPCLLADVRMVENHVHRPGDPLPCPMTVFFGLEDPTMRPPDARKWRDQTSGRFQAVPVRAGHFYLQEHFRSILQVVSYELSRLPRSANGA